MGNIIHALFVQPTKREVQGEEGRRQCRAARRRGVQTAYTALAGRMRASCVLQASLWTACRVPQHEADAARKSEGALHARATQRHVIM